MVAQEVEVIETLEQLWDWATRNNNAKLKGLINRLKYSNDLEEQILALASIIQALRRHRLNYTQHLIQQALLYIVGGD